MAEIGYTLMCEQTPARQLVDDAATAERTGFDYAVISDHYFPWLRSRVTRPTPGRSWARRRTPPTAAPHDVRDVPDDALSPGRGRAEGRHDGCAQPGPVLAGAGLPART